MRSALPLLLLLAACASDDAGSDTGIHSGDGAMSRPGWPSLAPRQGEVSPLVPRVPLGACVGCTSGVEPVAPLPAMADLPLPTRPVLPADAGARLAGIEADIARIEAAWPAALDSARAAVRSAPAGARDTEADVQASRFEALFQPLGPQESALAAIEAVLTDAEGGAALQDTANALRARITALDAARRNGLD